MKNCIVAIHQPNYFPWLGFFYKIFKADHFVFHDNVEHSKKYPTRRTKILNSTLDNADWLTIPLVKHADDSKIKDLLIDLDQNWKAKHLAILKNRYQNAPQFKFAFPMISHWLTEENSNQLAELNAKLIKYVCEYLEIQTTFHRSSDLPVTGKGAEYNLSLTTHLGGNIYLSGAGGKNYMGEVSKREITLVYSEFGNWLKENLHPQFQKGTQVFGLSIIDALFNIDKKEILSLFKKFDDTTQDSLLTDV